MMTKRRIVSVFLIVFGFWPLVHFALTQQFGVDPWRLFGWAMYSVPGPKNYVRIIGVDEEGWLTMLTADSAAPVEVETLADFVIQRRAVGRLASESDLVEILFEQHPDWAGFLIVMLVLQIDRTSALYEPTIEVSKHWRDEGEHRDVDLTEKALLELFSS